MPQSGFVWGWGLKRLECQSVAAFCKGAGRMLGAAPGCRSINQSNRKEARGGRFLTLRERRHCESAARQAGQKKARYPSPLSLLLAGWLLFAAEPVPRSLLVSPSHSTSPLFLLLAVSHTFSTTRTLSLFRSFSTSILSSLAVLLIVSSAPSSILHPTPSTCSAVPRPLTRPLLSAALLEESTSTTLRSYWDCV